MPAAMPTTIYFRLLYPFLYSAVGGLVFTFSMAGVAMMEKTIGLHTWRRVGDIDAAIFILTFGIIGFGLATKLLSRFEAVSKPGMLDHLRQSALLYLVASSAGVSMLLYYTEGNGALLYGYSTALFSASVVGIVINAYILLKSRHHQ